MPAEDAVKWAEAELKKVYVSRLSRPLPIFRGEQRKSSGRRGSNMAISAVSDTTLREAPPSPPPPPPSPRRQRLLEDERWLAFVLLVPTIVLLGLFIAYPFVRGILLSVTSSRVGVPGDFVGLANFYKIFNDGIFRTAVYKTFVSRA